jgi:hypothetical protein
MCGSRDYSVWPVQNEMKFGFKTLLCASIPELIETRSVVSEMKQADR